MSDIQLQTDEHVARTRAGYDAQRYGSMQQAGQSLQRFGEQIPAMQQAQQQIDQKWVEIGQRGAAQQAEIDIAQKKLLAAQALDQTELSRQTVRQITLQNDHVEQSLKMQRAQYDEMHEDRQAKLDAELAKTLNASGNEGRYKFDPNAPTGTRFTARTDAEFKAWTQEQQDAKSHAAHDDRRLYLMNVLRAASDPASPNYDEDVAKNAMRELVALDPTLSASFGKKKQEESKGWFDRAAEAVGSVAKNGTANAEAEKVSARIGGDMPAEQKQAVASQLLRARAGILQIMQQAGQKDATEQDAMERMLEDLNDTSEAGRSRREKLLALLSGLK